MKNALFIIGFIIVTYNSIGQTIGKYSLPDSTSSVEFPSVNSTEDKIYALSLLWSEIKYNFAKINIIPFNADSLYQKTLVNVLQTQNDIEFYNELKRFLGSFNDGHTQLLYESFDWNEYFDYIPYHIVAIDGQYYFSSYRIQDSSRPELLGASIIEIDDIPTKIYVKEKYFPYISASSNYAKWGLAAIPMQSGVKHTFFTGKALALDGQVYPFKIPYNGESTRTQYDKYFPETKKKRRINLEWYDGDIACIEINTFSQDIIPTMDSLFSNVRKKGRGLILDLRHNGGGDSDIALRVQMYITNSDSLKSFGIETRINDAYGRAQGNFRKEYEDFYLGTAYRREIGLYVMRDPEVQYIGCPCVVLIGPYTYSACEDLLINMYELPNKPLYIGNKTGGSTGTPLVIALPNDAAARICTINELFPYSLRNFKQGIDPDIKVQQTIIDYLNNKDPVIEKALDELNKQIKY